MNKLTPKIEKKGWKRYKDEENKTIYRISSLKFAKHYYCVDCGGKLSPTTSEVHLHDDNWLVLENHAFCRKCLIDWQFDFCIFDYKEFGLEMEYNVSKEVFSDDM